MFLTHSAHSLLTVGACELATLGLSNGLKEKWQSRIKDIQGAKRAIINLMLANIKWQGSPSHIPSGSTPVSGHFC